MKFYFCEKCGKRITEHDVSAGTASDKKLKGVFCVECGIGVTTNDFVPLTNEQARGIVEEEQSKGAPGPPKPISVPLAEQSTAQKPTQSSRTRIVPAGRNKRRSSAVMQPARRASERNRPPPTADARRSSKRLEPVQRPPARKYGMFFAGGFAGLLLAVIAALIIRSGRTPAQQPKEKATAPESTSIAKSNPNEVKPTPKPGKVVGVKAPPRKTDKKQQAPPAETPETRARTAFEKLRGFEGLAPEDRTGRIQLIQAFLVEHGRTSVATEARTLLDQLKKEQAQATKVNTKPPVAEGKTEPKKDVVEVKKPLVTGPPVARAKFLGKDDHTKGNWQGAYGEDGYILMAHRGKKKGLVKPNETDEIRQPRYLADFKKSGNRAQRFASNTKDPRGIRKLDKKGWLMTGDIGQRFTYDITFKDKQPHQIAVYLADYEGKSAQSIEIADAATGTVLDKQTLPLGSYKNGLYLRWTVTADIQIRLTKIEGIRAVCNAIYFDPLPDPNYERRLKDLRTSCDTWRTGGAEELEKLAEQFAEKDKPLTGLLRDAAKFRAATTAFLRSMGSRNSVKLSFKAHGKREGRISEMNGGTFVHRVSAQPLHYRLMDIELAARSEWVKERLKDAERLPAMTAAAALLDGDYEPASEALEKAGEEAQEWVPILRAQKALASALKTEDAWLGIKNLARPGKRGEFIKQAEAFMKKPPGAPLPSTLKEEVEAAIGKAREALEGSKVRLSELGLNTRVRKLPDGRVELFYNFSSARQLRDFGLPAVRRARVLNGEMQSRNVEMRMVLPFEGDLSYSYHVMTPNSAPSRIYLGFYKYEGEFGGGGNKWTGMWRKGSDSRKPIKMAEGIRIRQNQWHHIQVEFKAKEKKTRVTIDGNLALEFVEPRGWGKGTIRLGAGVVNKIRNLRIQGTPSQELIKKEKLKRAFAAELRKELSRGQMVKLFTEQDQPFWEKTQHARWRLVGGQLRGQRGRINLPPFPVRNYELKCEVKFIKGHQVALTARAGHGSAYLILFRPGTIIGHYHHHDKARRKALATVKCGFEKFHELHILSRGSHLTVVFDEKHTLINANDVPPNHTGFGIDGGEIIFRNIRARILR